jgi:GNAT superfamily N-acetyltransferase
VDGQGVVVRAAARGDEHAIFDLVRALAAYEKLESSVVGSAEALAEHLFGARPVAEALLAERAGAPIGFALFFTTYSTFLTRPGLYLEDLFVLERERGSGVGKALLGEVIRLARERGSGRLEWSVLDWNAPAIAFYERMGAQVLPDWRICRIVFEAPVAEP